MNQFASVSDSHCRRLCVIASYNTGAGNVSRSFIGTTNLSKALAHINRYNYDELFNHLITNLPYEETRNYVQRVIFYDYMYQYLLGEKHLEFLSKEERKGNY